MIYVTNILSLINKILYKKKFRILFYAPEGKKMTDNSKALYNYMIKHNYQNKYEVICCIPQSNFNGKVDYNIKVVGLLKGIYFYLTTKYIFYSFGGMRIKASHKQIIVNLGHGTPLKSLGKKELNRKYKNEKTNDFTYALATSEYFKEIIASIHGCELEQIIIQGHPRNDYLYSDKDSFKQLSIDRKKYNKIVLWMPTFRILKNRYNDLGKEYIEGETLLPLLENYEDLEKVNNFLHTNKILLAIKVHPGAEFTDIKYSNIKLYTNKILDKNNIKLYEFIKDFDALLTDYSSIAFDYLLLNRPIGYTIDDYDLYKKNRGFSVENPLSLMPGHHIKNIIELKSFFMDLLNEEDKYRTERIRVNDKVNYNKDGNFRKKLLQSIKLEK